MASLLNVSSLADLDNSTHYGNIWENFVFTEFFKSGYIPGRNMFYYRDQNGVEIDFILENKAEIALIEAKSSERPHPDKLNFHKVGPLFRTKAKSIVACGMEESGVFSMKDYSMYNPLYGLDPFLES